MKLCKALNPIDNLSPCMLFDNHPDCHEDAFCRKWSDSIPGEKHDLLEMLPPCQIAEIKDGDTLIFNLKENNFSKYTIEVIQEKLSKVFPNNKVLVMVDTEVLILREKLKEV